MERRATAEKSGADVVMDAGEESGSGAESGWSGVSNTAGRCCLYRAVVRVIYLYVVYPTHCHVTMNGATSRCQWACHQYLPNTLASYMFWSPPIVVHH